MIIKFNKEVLHVVLMGALISGLASTSWGMEDYQSVETTSETRIQQQCPAAEKVLEALHATFGGREVNKEDLENIDNPFFIRDAEGTYYRLIKARTSDEGQGFTFPTNNNRNFTKFQVGEESELAGNVFNKSQEHQMKMAYDNIPVYAYIQTFDKRPNKFEAFFFIKDSDYIWNKGREGIVKDLEIYASYFMRNYIDFYLSN